MATKAKTKKSKKTEDDVVKKKKTTSTKKKTSKKKKAVKKPPVVLDRDDLVLIAKEMNVTMGLTPTIKVVKSQNEADIATAIVQNAAEIQETDSFIETTITALKTLIKDKDVLAVINKLVPAKSKKDAVKNRTKNTVKKNTRTRGESQARIDFMSKLVEQGKYTRNEILAAAVKEFPEAKEATLGTNLSDGKNPRYCKKWPALIVQDDQKCLSFKK